MANEFSIQSSIKVDTSQAREEIAALERDYAAVRARLLQPIPLTMDTPARPNIITAAAAQTDVTADGAPNGPSRPPQSNLQAATLSFDTTEATARLHDFEAEFAAVRARLLQPIPLTMDTPNILAEGSNGKFRSGFDLDTSEARDRLAELSRDSDDLRRRMKNPVSVPISVPVSPNGGETIGKGGGVQPLAIQADTTRASDALARLGVQFDELRARMTRPISMDVQLPNPPGGNSGGGHGGAGGDSGRFGGGHGGFMDFGLMRGVFGSARRLMDFSLGIPKLLWAGFQSAFSLISGGMRMLATGPVSLLRVAIGGITSAIRGVATAFSLMAQVGRTAVSVLTPAAELQQRSINMQVLLKDPDNARRRLEELERYAKETNYSPGEVIEASNLMQAFGIHGDGLTRLKLAGDAANAFGKDIREVVTSLNYLGSGRGGEAFESLARIGVTRDKLKPYGVKFNAQGVLLTDTKAALKAVFRYFEDNFGGATRRQAKTFKGALQQAAGEVTYALSHGLKGALAPVTDFVRSAIIPSISRIGKSIEKIDWRRTLGAPLTSIKKVIDPVVTTASRLIDPDTRGHAWDEMKLLGKGLLDSGKVLLSGLLGIGKGLLQDLGATLEGFVGNGVFSSIMSTFWNLGKTVLFGFLDAGRLVLDGFSDKFKSGLLMALDRIPGIDTGETSARQAADKSAKNNVLADVKNGYHGKELQILYNTQFKQLEVDKLSRTKEAVQKYMMREFYKQPTAAEMSAYSQFGGVAPTGWDKETNREIYEKIGKATSVVEIKDLILRLDASPQKRDNAILALDSNHTGNQEQKLWEAIGGHGNPALRRAYDEKLASMMGWGNISTRGIESRTSGSLDRTVASFKDTFGKVASSVTFKHTGEAGRKFMEEDLPQAAAPIREFASQQRRQSAIRARYNARHDRLGTREEQIDAEIERKETAYRREEKRIGRGRGSYDELNRITISIGTLERERRRIRTERGTLERSYARQSNSQSARWQMAEASRQAENPAQREIRQRAVAANRQFTARRRALARDVEILEKRVQARRELGLTNRADEFELELSEKKRQLAATRQSQMDAWQSAARKWRAAGNAAAGPPETRSQTGMQTQNQGTGVPTARPAVPGVRQGADTGSPRKDASAEIARNTAATKDGILALAAAFNSYIRRNTRLEEQLRMVLEV